MNDKEKILNKFNENISKFIKKDKINHAYLIETNYKNTNDLAKELIKKILSFEETISIDEMIKNSDLTIIKSETNVIKVEEIDSLREKFKTKSVTGNKRIYIIDGAEKLNDFASNKLLKFIEEPEDDIIAILLTTNKSSVLKTIVSRCQNIRFFVYEDKFNEYDQEYIESMFDFVMNIEENKEKSIAFQNRYDIKKLTDRKYINDFLNNILFIYDDVMQYKVNKNVEYFPYDIEKIEKISNENDIKQIKNKINAINTCIERLKYNPNIKLLIDKLIILMTGVE